MYNLIHFSDPIQYQRTDIYYFYTNEIQSYFCLCNKIQLILWFVYFQVFLETRQCYESFVVQKLGGRWPTLNCCSILTRTMREQSRQIVHLVFIIAKICFCHYKPTGRMQSDGNRFSLWRLSFRPTLFPVTQMSLIRVPEER